MIESNYEGYRHEKLLDSDFDLPLLRPVRLKKDLGRLKEDTILIGYLPWPKVLNPSIQLLVPDWSRQDEYYTFPIVNIQVFPDYIKIGGKQGALPKMADNLNKRIAISPDSQMVVDIWIQPFSDVELVTEILLETPLARFYQSIKEAFLPSRNSLQWASEECRYNDMARQSLANYITRRQR